MIDILKNPIVIGLFSGALIYFYLYWSEEQRSKKNPSSKKKLVSVVTPGVVAVIIWFIASSYLDPKTISTSNTNVVQETNNMIPVENVNGSLHIIHKNNIRLPSSDVFIDYAKF